MKTDRFLDQRQNFANEIDAPDLYKYIDQFSLYAGVHTLGNKLWTYELLKSTVGVPGDIWEFGCWQGANLMFLAKISSLLEPQAPKQIIGFDNFSGLPEAGDKDGEYAKNQKGRYHGNGDILRKAIELFGLEEKIELVAGDARQTIPEFTANNPSSLCSFAYLDFDLYEPTKAALSLVEKSIARGGVIVFDEACTKEWPGETLAMKEFLKESDHHFEMLSNSISRQPTVALRRIG